MARISTYDFDPNPGPEDNVLGTNRSAGGGNETVLFPLSSVSSVIMTPLVGIVPERNFPVKGERNAFKHSRITEIATAQTNIDLSAFTISYVGSGMLRISGYNGVYDLNSFVEQNYTSSEQNGELLELVSITNNTSGGVDAVFRTDRPSIDGNLTSFTVANGELTSTCIIGDLDVKGDIFFLTADGTRMSVRDIGGGTGSGGAGGITTDANGNLIYRDLTPVGPSLPVGNGAESLLDSPSRYVITDNGDGTYGFSNLTDSSLSIGDRFVPHAFRTGDTVLFTITPRDVTTGAVLAPVNATGVVSDIVYRDTTNSVDVGRIQSFTFTTTELSATMFGGGFTLDVVEMTIARPATEFVRSPINVQDVGELNIITTSSQSSFDNDAGTVTLTGVILPEEVDGTPNRSTNLADVVILNQLYFVKFSANDQSNSTYRVTAVDLNTNAVVFTFVGQSGLNSLTPAQFGISSGGGYTLVGEFNLQIVAINLRAVPGPVNTPSGSNLQNELRALSVPIGGVYYSNTDGNGTLRIRLE